jgi:hypothetical protein
MRAQAFLLAVVFGLVPALSAQQGSAAPTVNIRASMKIPLPSGEPALPVGGVMCDDEGNIYARLLAPKASNGGTGVFRLPIEEITPEGRLAQTFRVTDISDEVSGKHIFVLGDGTVYQLAITAEGIYAVEFSKDGGVKRKVRLEISSPSVQPWDLAVFREGGYLLTGEAGKDNRTPYTAVFDSSGRLVKNIYEPEDEGARRKAESGDIAYAPSIRGNRFVSQGAIAAGSDGNVYLLRGASPTLIYAISSKGEVVRKLHVDTGPDFDARRIESHAGKLAIGFEGPTTLVKIIDLEGKAIASYTVGGEGHMDLACYSPQGLTFIASRPAERSYLLRANLQ